MLSFPHSSCWIGRAGAAAPLSNRGGRGVRIEDGGCSAPIQRGGFGGGGALVREPGLPLIRAAVAPGPWIGRGSAAGPSTRGHPQLLHSHVLCLLPDFGRLD